MLMWHDFKAFNLYWQIMETKSKNWDIIKRHLRKQNPVYFSERMIWTYAELERAVGITDVGKLKLECLK